MRSLLDVVHEIWFKAEEFAWGRKRHVKFQCHVDGFKPVNVEIRRVDKDRFAILVDGEQLDTMWKSRVKIEALSEFAYDRLKNSALICSGLFHKGAL